MKSVATAVKLGSPTPIFLALVVAASACADEDDAAAPADAGALTVESESDGPDAGVPAPPLPPKRIFAKRFVVNVRTGPSRDAPRIGYLRAGAVLQAKTAEPVGTDGCRGGWYELSTGGFVCNRRDVIAFEGRRLPEWRATQPDPSAKLPYVYGYIRRDNTPMYRRLPTDEEAAEHEGYRIPGAEPPASAEATAEADAGVALAATETAAAEEVVDAGPPTLASLQGDRESVVMRRMMKGFWVSLDRELRAGRRKYWRTQSNGFLPFDRVGIADGSDFRGVTLDGTTWALPLGYVVGARVAAFERREDGRLRRARAAPEYHHAFRIAGEEEIRGQPHVIGGDGFLYRARDITRIDVQPRPPEVGEGEKWIDVDLATQSLVAYEGDRPVYATLISSGRVRNPDNPLQNHATPTGTWRLTSKHVATTMDGDHVIDGPYSIDDVPYVMYFELAYALHSAFWHDRFGRPKSHGCVNMAPLDARWLFQWATPRLPEGWHGVYPTETDRGTFLRIRGETPRG